jgi:group II intron reverse transcriptase/maturase
MEQDAKGIRLQSATYPKVQNLMHNVNEETLMAKHEKQSGKKAVGVDGIDKHEYDANAEGNIADLIWRMRRFSYKPQPVRRTYIPKADGKLRPLGIPAYEDRLVQGVMADLLNDVYEERFLDGSYGFRPERSAHDVVAFVNQTIMTKEVGYVLEADIKGFFDNVNHDWLMKFLANDIQDKNFLRYVKRFLIAGVMEGTELLDSEKGTPQGGQISPILANVYLHYVLDLWFEKAVKPKLEGEAYYVRFADDFLIMFQYEDEGMKVLEALKTRLSKFSLELAEDKTRLLPMGRYKGTKESFDFLGFTFYNTKSRKGIYRVGIRTSAKKLKAKRQAAKAWLRTRLTKPVSETMQKLAAALRGHYNYYGVNGNFKFLHKFYYYVMNTTYRMLNRRDQKGRLQYPKFNRIWGFYIEAPHLTKNIWDWQPKTA